MASPSHSPAGQRLARARIVRRPALLHAARKRMRRLESPVLLLYVERSAPEARAREGQVAFLTPKKIGGAVLRQRVRRRLREIFRREIPWRERSWRWLWVAREGAGAVSFEELRAHMLELAVQAQRLLSGNRS